MKILRPFLVAATALGLALSVKATPHLLMGDGVAITNVDDGSPQDLNPLNGSITYSYADPIGGWNVRVDATTKPALGSATDPALFLTFTAVSAGSGFVLIDFTEFGFLASGFFTNVLSGTTDGSVLDAVWKNTASNTSYYLTGISNVPTPTFAETSSGPFSIVPSDQLELLLYIEHKAAGITSGSVEVTFAPATHSVPDAASTAGLLGLALAGLCVLRRPLLARHAS
jgi:hypothetical protein